MNKRLIKIIISSLIFFVAIIGNFNLIWLNIMLYSLSYIIIGYDVVFKALKGIFRKNIFNENLLMTIATIGAFAIGDFQESVAVMLFYQVGELFQSYAVKKSRKSIASLMDIRPDYANLLLNSSTEKVDPETVKIGQIILIKPGEKIPLDSTVIDGKSLIDTSALTGESMPKEVDIDSELLSGSINLNGTLKAIVTKIYQESTVSKILNLVENASSKKSNQEKFITKFAKYYTPIVVIIAVLLAVLPPLIFSGTTFTDWIYRALEFLVVSCPCALVISIPLSFFGGIGGASKKGILIKGSNYIETLSQSTTVLFDKTGTLTKGNFKVQQIYAKNMSSERLLELTAYTENYSTHPIANSIKEAFKKEIDISKIQNATELSGLGLSAVIDNLKVNVGNAKMLERLQIEFEKPDIVGTIVYIAVDNKYAGYILIADEIKEDAKRAIQLLKTQNIKQTIILTGDNDSITKHIANELGIDKYYSDLLPHDKIEKLEEIMNSKSNKEKIIFVGDGINDAPALARADVGIAMGGLGSDAAIEAADIVIMTDEPSKIATAIKISKKTLSIAKQNTIFAIGIKISVLALCAFGLVSMWAAVFADVGVTILAVLNSFRTLKVKNL